MNALASFYPFNASSSSWNIPRAFMILKRNSFERNVFCRVDKHKWRACATHEANQKHYEGMNTFICFKIARGMHGEQ